MRNLSAQFLVFSGIVLIVVKLIFELLVPIGLALLVVGGLLYFFPGKEGKGGRG